MMKTTEPIMRVARHALGQLLLNINITNEKRLEYKKFNRTYTRKLENSYEQALYKLKAELEKHE